MYCITLLWFIHNPVWSLNYVFYSQSNAEKENLCLYGFPSESWEVNLPAEEVPPELPEPALGINFARDGMQEKDWLSLVAVHSDAWLLSVAFYFGARFGFDRADRYVSFFKKTNHFRADRYLSQLTYVLSHLVIFPCCFIWYGLQVCVTNKHNGASTWLVNLCYTHLSCS